MKTLAAIVLAMAAALPAHQARAEELDFQIVTPPWITGRSAGDAVDRLFPDRALRMATPGRAVIHCEVKADGRLAHCVGADETPPDFGFTDTALSAAWRLHVDLSPAAGAPVVNGQVDIPFEFRLGGRFSAGAVTLIDPPTPAEIAAAYPARAADIDGGQVVLLCGMTVGGALSHCRSASERPSNRGFGAAAASLAGLFKYRVASASAVENLSVELPVSFFNPNRPTPPIMMTNPAWRRQFNPEALMSIYPAQATKAGAVSGKAVIDCGLAHTGEMTDCKLISEEPLGLGFGDAAMKVVSVMAVYPWTADGRPVDGVRLKLPIVLRSPDAAATTYVNPQWLRRPSGDEIQAAYPDLAFRSGLGGAVVMDCQVGAEGVLGDCAIVRESPPGLGFGAATLALAPYFRVTPKTADGVSTAGAKIEIPLKWNPPPQ